MEQEHAVNLDRLDLTIIIVSYNTCEMTIECIRSIHEQTAAVKYDIIVVDNASIDGSVGAIRQNFPDIKLIALDHNIGFGAANNLAAKRAEGRLLLLLNPDTIVLNRAINRLHEFAIANPQCLVWGGRTVFADGKLNPQSCWRRMTLWSIFCNAVGLVQIKGSATFNPEGYGGWKRDSVREVDIVTGCFFLIDRRLWRDLGGFDPRFFMYGEEADLCLRARKLGARPMVTPDATIIHYGGASEVNQADQRVKLLAGKITVLQHHESGLTVAVGRRLFLLLPLLRMVVFKAASAVFPKNDWKRKADIWKQVWRSRRSWIYGYDAMSAEVHQPRV